MLPHLEHNHTCASRIQYYPKDLIDLGSLSLVAGASTHVQRKPFYTPTDGQIRRLPVNKETL